MRILLSEALKAALAVWPPLSSRSWIHTILLARTSRLRCFDSLEHPMNIAQICPGPSATLGLEHGTTRSAAYVVMGPVASP